MTHVLPVAMVGCGFFAQNHLHGWKALQSDGAELVAVCDVDQAKAERAAQQFGTRAFTNLEEMIAKVNPGLVDVATRMDTHLPIFEILARHRIPTILQKPLAPSWDDCCRIAALADKTGTFLAVHENFRFQTPMRRLKQILDEGTIGAISWARLSFRTGYDVYGNQPYFYDEDRLVILDVGIHVLDLARVLLGEVSHVSCETQRRNPRVKAEDTATMLLRHTSGAVSVVECTYEARRLPDPFPHTRVEIEGEKGALTLQSDDEILITNNGHARREAVLNPLSDWMAKPWHVVQQSVYETSRSILNAVRDGVPAATGIHDNLKTYAIVEAAYAAAASGKSEGPPKWLNHGAAA